MDEEEVLETVETPSEPSEPEQPPKPIEYELEGFKDYTPDDPIDKDDIIIYHLRNMEEVLASPSPDSPELTEINKNLSTLIEQGSTGESTLGDANSQMISQLETLNTKVDEALVGSNTITTYGLIYVPLFIICFLLWRFFSTFLKTAY